MSRLASHDRSHNGRGHQTAPFGVPTAAENRLRGILIGRIGHWEVELRLSAEMLFFGRARLDVAPNLVRHLIIVTARAVQQTTRNMNCPMGAFARQI